MNFTPFTTPFTGTIPVHQFTAKFANANGQTTTVPPGTVVLSGGDGGIHYLRPTEVVSQAGTLTNQTLITVPVNLEQSTSKEEGSTTTVDAHTIQPTATVQNFDNNFSLQVLNHAGIKYNITPVSMQHFSQVGAPGTVLTVAYPADLDGITVDGKGTQTQMIPVEIQGQDLCATLVVAAPSGDADKVLFRTQEADGNLSDTINGIPVEKLITIKREEGADDGKEGSSSEQQIELQGQTLTATMPATWQSIATPGSTVAEYLSRLPASTLPLSLHHFLKFSAESIKRENNEACTVTLPPAQPIVVTTLPDADGGEGTVTVTTVATAEGATEEADAAGKAKKRRRGTKKVKQPKMRPGQVQLTTALDGTTLFCCPECNMAYPDKDLLEQHLVAHKIERRFICDICGAGLKRKEHLDRHKQGHNPERPFICSVCMKGFKRKEHLNLHFVIHSGEKTHICPECGKGFYRKDHLRKHSRSHLAKRIKSEMNNTANATQQATQPPQLKIEVIQQVPSADTSSPTDDPLKLIPLSDKLV